MSESSLLTIEQPWKKSKPNNSEPHFKKLSIRLHGACNPLANKLPRNPRVLLATISYREVAR